MKNLRELIRKNFTRFLNFALYILSFAFLINAPPVFALDDYFKLEFSYPIPRRPIGFACGTADGTPVFAIGIIPNFIQCITAAGKELWQFRTPVEIQTIESLVGNILIWTPPDLVCLDARGKECWRRRVLTGGQKSLFKVIDSRIFLLSGNRLHRFDTKGNALDGFSLPSRPRDFLVIDSYYVFADRDSVFCLTEQGKKRWSFLVPRAIEPTALPLLFSGRTSSKQRSKPESSPIMIYQAPYCDGSPILKDSLFGFDVATGTVKWKFLLRGVCSDVVLKDNYFYLAGGDSDFGVILKIDSTGKFIADDTLDVPYFSLMPTDEYVTALTVNSSLRIYDLNCRELLSIFYMVTPIQTRTADLNNDGYPDICILRQFFEDSTRYSLDVFTNQLPRILGEASQNAIEGEMQLKAKHYQEADKLLSKANATFQYLGRSAATAEISITLRHIKIIQHNGIVRKEFLRGGAICLVLIGVIALGICFGLPAAKRGFPKAKMWLMKTVTGQPLKPSVEILKELEVNFIHEMKKKLGKLRAALREMEQGSPSLTLPDFTRDAIVEIEEKYQDYRLELLRLIKANPTIMKEAEKALKTLKQDVVESSQIKEALKILDGLVADAQDEIYQYKYSIRNTVEMAIEAVKKEKMEELKSYAITLDDSIPEAIFSKNFYYDQKEQWENVFKNILRNGIEAMVSAIAAENIPLPRRKVSVALIRTSSLPPKAIITIEDFGSGMDEQTKNLIFKRGYSRGKKEGMGVGLTEEMRQYIEKNGKISIESDLGKGTKFTIEIYNA